MLASVSICYLLLAGINETFLEVDITLLDSDA